jgi:hypothetical protein
MGKRQTHIQKHGNSRQPTTGYSNPHARVETSWRSPDAPASNTRGNLAQTPRATGTVDSRGDVLEHGLADGDELQDDADAEEQEAEQLKAKHGGKKGKHNAGVEKPLSQQRQSEASPRKPAPKRKMKHDEPTLAENRILPASSIRRSRC